MACIWTSIQNITLQVSLTNSPNNPLLIVKILPGCKKWLIALCRVLQADRVSPTLNSAAIGEATQTDLIF